MIGSLRRFFFILVLSTYQPVSSEVLIITHAFNRTDFIGWQARTFEEFMLDDYRFVVFNDASGTKIRQKIFDTCRKLNIECLPIPQEIHDRPYLPRWPSEQLNAPAVRHANGLQYSLDKLGFQHDDVVMIVDSDLFLTREFSPKEYMRNTILAGRPQSREKGKTKVNYLWPGILLLNMPLLTDKQELSLNCGQVDNVPVDAGGCLHYWLKNHPNAPIKKMNITKWKHTPSAVFKTTSRDLLVQIKKENISTWFILDDYFLHYGAGTNWHGKNLSHSKKKTAIIKNYIDLILS